MKWRIADFILIGFVLICALGIWLIPATSGRGEQAKIAQGEKVSTLPLNRDVSLQLENALVVIKDGEIFIENSHCPDQVCVKTGGISRCGESIICVPNEIVITIEGESTVDAVSN